VEAEAGGRVIGGGGLGFFAGGGNAAADAAPEVDFVRDVDGQNEITGVASGVDVGAVAGSVDGVDAGAGGDGGKLRGAIEADGGTGFAEAGLGNFEILVGDGELFFERV